MAEENGVLCILIEGPTEVLGLKFWAQCSSRYFTLQLLWRNCVHKVAIVFDKKISLKEITAIEDGGESSWEENCQ